MVSSIVHLCNYVLGLNSGLGFCCEVSLIGLIIPAVFLRSAVVNTTTSFNSEDFVHEFNIIDRLSFHLLMYKFERSK